MVKAILIVALIMLLCVLFNKLSNKIGIPMLLAFILLGMIFGTDGIFKIKFENYVFAEQICTLALIFIMFYGGFGTKWSEAKPIAGKAALLSTFGVLFTAALVGIFCYFVLQFDFWESFLIGSVISSTDAASVFSVLRSKKLGLKYHTASMLEVESGSNDTCSYMLTVIVLSLMEGHVGVRQVAYMLFAQFVYGIVIGVGIAVGALFILRKFHFGSEGFDMAFVTGIALLSYALPTLVGGNGYLSVYIVGIVIGNGKIREKQSLVHFFDGVTGLMQMLIFFLLGLLASPSHMPDILIPALMIAAFLTFVARPIAVCAILSPAGCKRTQKLLVSFSGLRGAASIVFAIMATVEQSHLKHDVFHIIFCIVLFSILFQGTLIPSVARKLDMIDADADVLKTFNDYANEVDLQFIKLVITEVHPWRDKAVLDLNLPPDTLLVMVLRGKIPIVPSGKTVIMQGDIVILSGFTFVDDSAICLTEQKIPKNSKWKNKTISEFSPEPGELIIMMKRGDHIIIPRGNTVIEENDILVLNATNV
ncbi:MAG: potassium/proton antiporter [Evtepia sp.]